MIPSDVDIPSILEQLNTDGVAFTYDHPGNEALNGELVKVLDYARDHGYDNPGFILLSRMPVQLSDARDIAQRVADMRESDLVIVRAPDGAAVVSLLHPRADIEQAEYTFASTPDYVSGSYQLINDLPQSTIGTGLFFSAGLVLMALTAGVTAWDRHISSKQ